MVSRVDVFIAGNSMATGAGVGLYLSSLVVSSCKCIDGYQAQQQSKQGKWYNVFTPATSEVGEYLKEVILEAYQQSE